MWFGYETALKSYINACIETWIGRGYKNTMATYEVPEEYERPAWTLDPNFHRTHRAALLEKELTRNEKPWYINKVDFTSAGSFTGYIWL
jgi:hypothetical protein